jgi:AAA domain/Transcriptional regulator, AbiEi antitoxin
VRRSEEFWGLDPGEAGSASPNGSPSELLVGLRNGAWLDQQEFPPLTYAVPGIVPEGLVLKVGAPKIGKSWMVLSHALAAASGGITLDAIRVGPPRPVLYLALEDGDRRLQQRCRRLLGSEPIPPQLSFFTRVMPGLVIVTIAAWLELHAAEPAFVILDTLGKVMPTALPGESAYQRDYRVGSMLRALCDQYPGLTLLVNHHDRKAGSDDFVDSVSGTHGLAGAADTILVLTRDRHGTEGLLKVTGRDVPEDEYALRFLDGGHWTLDGDDLAGAAQRARERQVTAGLGDRSTEVVGYVLKHPAGVSPTDVAAALNMDPAQARVYLSRAVQAGRIEKPARGLYTPVTTVTSVTSERASWGSCR